MNSFVTAFFWSFDRKRLLSFAVSSFHNDYHFLIHQSLSTQVRESHYKNKVLLENFQIKDFNFSYNIKDKHNSISRILFGFFYTPNVPKNLNMIFHFKQGLEKLKLATQHVGFHSIS